MKHYIIWKNRSSLELQCEARNGKQALQHFLNEYILNTSIYSFHKVKGIWHMTDCMGNDYEAIEGTL